MVWCSARLLHMLCYVTRVACCACNFVLYRSAKKSAKTNMWRRTGIRRRRSHLCQYLNGRCQILRLNTPNSIFTPQTPLGKLTTLPRTVTGTSFPRAFANDVEHSLPNAKSKTWSFRSPYFKCNVCFWVKYQGLLHLGLTACIGLHVWCCRISRMKLSRAGIEAAVIKGRQHAAS